MGELGPADVIAIERIECEALLDMYDAAPRGVRAELGISHHAIDGGVLIICKGIDDLQFNRVAGLGVASPARAETLDWALAEFESAGVRNWVVHVAEGAVGLDRLCLARGLVAHPRTWAKFKRDGSRVAAGTDLHIRKAESADADAFGDVAARTYGLPPAAARWIAALVGRPHWHCIMALDGGSPVATGVVFIQGDAAWLGIGATLPSHRRRGAQSALLAGRIDVAARFGCNLLTTETGVPHAGEAGPSYANIQRAGFRVAYLRPNLRRP
jgi:GNAT superfamily N-acetyltransferase